MNILVFFAHPDDETMLCGGLLALLASANQSVFYLSCTRGEGGECGEPPLCSQEELGEVREKELECAVKALGGAKLKILDYQDPLIGPDNTLYSFTNNVDELMGKLSEFVRQNMIEVLITHGSNGEYGHPGHLTVYETAKRTVIEKFPHLTWYTVQANYDHSTKEHLLNKDDPADWVLDITLGRQMKLNAAQCHQTQHALFVRRKTKELERPVELDEIIQVEEGYHFANGDTDLLKEIPIIKENLLPSK